MANNLIYDICGSTALNSDFDVCFCYFEEKENYNSIEVNCDTSQTYRCVDRDPDQDPYKNDPDYILVNTDSEEVTCINRKTRQTEVIGTHHFYRYKRKNIETPIADIKYAFEVYKQNNSKRSDYGQIKYVRNASKDKDCNSVLPPNVDTYSCNITQKQPELNCNGNIRYYNGKVIYKDKSIENNGSMQVNVSKNTLSLNIETTLIPKDKDIIGECNSNLYRNAFVIVKSCNNIINKTLLESTGNTSINIDKNLICDNNISIEYELQ